MASAGVSSWPRLALLDDPNSGIDVLSVSEITRLERQMADEGISMLFWTQKHTTIVLLLSALSVVLIGVADYVTGCTFSFGAVYLLPVVLVTRALGRNIGMLIQLIMLGYAATTDVRDVPVAIYDQDRTRSSCRSNIEINWLRSWLVKQENDNELPS